MADQADYSHGGPVLQRSGRELVAAGFDLEPVARENLHLTLHFIGESPASSVPRLVGALEEVAARIPAFDLETRLQAPGVSPLPPR